MLYNALSVGKENLACVLMKNVSGRRAVAPFSRIVAALNDRLVLELLPKRHQRFLFYIFSKFRECPIMTF